MDKPNIVFIVCDDLRYESIGVSGNSEVMTPNLDALACNGVSFDEAHIPGGCCGAVCMPSRAMIHGSKFPSDLKELGAVLPEEQSLLGEELQENGYQTIGIGKWHNGTAGYQRSFSDGDRIYFGGMWDHWNVPTHTYEPSGIYEDWKPFSKSSYTSNEVKLLNTNQIQQGTHSTDLFTDASIDFLRNKLDKSKPFFLYTAFMAPHDPRTMPQKYADMYQDLDVELPENFAAIHEFDFGVFDERDEVLEAYPRTPEKIKQHIRDYYAMITHIDDSVGRMVNELKEQGLYDNTIFIFTADHGLMLGQQGLMGKQNLYEPSVKVPLLMAGPGLPKNYRSDDFVYLMDIFPTLCDLLNIETPEDLRGESVLPLLAGEKAGRDHLYAGFLEIIRSYRTKDNFKFIAYQVEGEIHKQLFNLAEDPYETRNLAAEASYEEKVRELEAKLFKEAVQWNDLDFLQGQVFWENYKTASPIL